LGQGRQVEIQKKVPGITEVEHMALIPTQTGVNTAETYLLLSIFFRQLRIAQKIAWRRA